MRILIRHISGSKSNQVEEFPAKPFHEITIGRDPACTVKYDPERDDLVGRNHAKLSQTSEEPAEFSIVDLNSRNGTYLNKQRIYGSAAIHPGDLVQFGPGGPEFQFDLEPRPASAKPTRVEAAMPPTTREAGLVSPTRPAEPPAAAPAKMGVGKETVERMILQQTKETRKTLWLGVGMAVLIALGAGVYVVARKPPLPGKTKLDPTAIAQKYTDAVVFLSVSWKLVDTDTGKLVYHMYVQRKDGARVPVYIKWRDSSVQPYLCLDDRGGVNRPIGGTGFGSGFVVTSDGFVLTNRHVAAGWEETYDFAPGVIIDLLEKKTRGMSREDVPQNWIPSRAGLVFENCEDLNSLSARPQEPKHRSLEGRHDYLYVTMAKNKLRTNGKPSRVLDRHDVAMVKIDVPQSLQRVDMYPSDDDGIRQGDQIVVMGYPAVSPDLLTATSSADGLRPGTELAFVPVPTVSVGNVGRILKSEAATVGGRGAILSTCGDCYQLTVNSTGAGSSGGPVFNSDGQVVGIFFATRKTDAMISFAVPIRYGRELMGLTKVVH